MQQYTIPFTFEGTNIDLLVSATSEKRAYKKAEVFKDTFFKQKYSYLYSSYSTLEYSYLLYFAYPHKKYQNELKDYGIEISSNDALTLIESIREVNKSISTNGGVRKSKWRVAFYPIFKVLIDIKRLAHDISDLFRLIRKQKAEFSRMSNEIELDTEDQEKTRYPKVSNILSILILNIPMLILIFMLTFITNPLIKIFTISMVTMLGIVNIIHLIARLRIKNGKK